VKEIIKAYTDPEQREYYLALLGAKDLVDLAREKGSRLAGLLKTFPNVDIQDILKTIIGSKEYEWRMMQFLFYFTTFLISWIRIPNGLKAPFQSLLAISNPSVRHALETATKAGTQYVSTDEYDTHLCLHFILFAVL
jgi:hypothetical protein